MAAAGSGEMWDVGCRRQAGAIPRGGGQGALLLGPSPGRPPREAGLPEPQTSAFSLVRAVPPSSAFSGIPALSSPSLTASPDRPVPGEVFSPCTWGSREPSETQNPPRLCVPAWTPLSPGDTRTLNSPFLGFRAKPARSRSDYEIVEHSPGASKGRACGQT